MNYKGGVKFPSGIIEKIHFKCDKFGQSFAKFIGVLICSNLYGFIMMS